MLIEVETQILGLGGRHDQADELRVGGRREAIGTLTYSWYSWVRWGRSPS